MKRLVVAALALALTALAAPVAAQQQDSTQMGLSRSSTAPLQDSVLEARVTRLASELRCPVCQGLSIHDSPSPLAQEMKGVIRTQVAAGQSDDEIRDYFVSKYGEWVLLEPPAHGFNLLVYLLPALALLGGAGLIMVAVRRWTEPLPEPDAETPDESAVSDH